MGNFYDDSKFGVVQRKWFGLTKKHGGDCAAGYTFGVKSATSQTAVSKWYPRGPIMIKKIGARVLATVQGSGSTDRISCRVLTRGASASVAGTFSLDLDGSTLAPYSMASLSSMTIGQVKAGEYITIRSGTPKTAKGTAANTSTTSGTVAYFIDYTPRYDATGKWDV